MHDTAPDDHNLLQLETTSEVHCPYCGEFLTIEVDPGSAGVMVQDCEVCCRPWQLTVSRDDDGCLMVDIHASD